jgi:CheY-like chemotaxis protein
MNKSQRVLVVDDDPGIRETMWDILTLEGYEVQLAESGEEAVERYRAEHFSIVLLDVNMGGISGIEALRQIRTQDPEVRAIMITGLDGGNVTAECRDAGAEAVFRKPLDVATFLPVLLMN